MSHLQSAAAEREAELVDAAEVAEILAEELERQQAAAAAVALEMSAKVSVSRKEPSGRGLQGCQKFSVG